MASFHPGNHNVYTSSECRSLWAELLRHHAVSPHSHLRLTAKDYIAKLHRSSHCDFDAYPMLRRHYMQLGHDTIDRLIKDAEPDADLLAKAHASICIHAYADERNLLESAPLVYNLAHRFRKAWNLCIAI